MLRTIRMILLIRLAMLTSGCSGVTEAQASENAPQRVPLVKEGHAVFDSRATSMAQTSCPALALSVFDPITELSFEVSVSVGAVTAALSAGEVRCRPAEERVHVFSRVSEWVLPDVDNRAHWIHVVGADYDGSTARLQYLDPDGGALNTAWVGCEAPPNVTAKAPGFAPTTASADTARISGLLAEDDAGGTVWQLTCDFYVPSTRLSVSRSFPSIGVRGPIREQYTNANR